MPCDEWKPKVNWAFVDKTQRMFAEMLLRLQRIREEFPFDQEIENAIVLLSKASEEFDKFVEERFEPGD